MEKGYTIPIVDISGETSRQVVVDREKGLYLGHPTTALLDDGKTILIVFPKNHGNGQIVLKRSTDGGLTWSERLPVPESFSTSLEVPTIFRMTDKAEVKRIVLFTGFYPIRMAFSEDDGVNFSELKPIGNFGGIVTMGDCTEVGKGEYIAIFHDDGHFINGGNSWKQEVWSTGDGAERRTKLLHYYSDDEGATWGEPHGNWVPTLEKSGDNWVKIHESFADKDADDSFRLYQVKSVDGGLTWSEPRVILHEKSVDLCEPAIIRSPDGRQLVTLLRENSRKSNSCMLISDDNSETWSAPIELPAALTGDRHCARYLKDGRLFISFRDTTRESATKGDWVGWVGTYDDIINLREGQYRVRLMRDYKNSDCGYPGVEVLPDGTVVTTTYGHWEKDEEAYIVSVRFHPSELDQRLQGSL